MSASVNITYHRKARYSTPMSTLARLRKLASRELLDLGKRSDMMVITGRMADVWNIIL